MNMNRALLLFAIILCVQVSSAQAQGIPPLTGQERFLVGQLCTFSGGSPYATSSYSRNGWAVFDGRGNYQYGSETAFSSGAGMAYGGGPPGSGQYRIKGNLIYLFDSDGSVDRAQIQMRQSSGRITEVMYGSDLYAVQLCH